MYNYSDKDRLRLRWNQYDDGYYDGDHDEYHDRENRKNKYGDEGRDDRFGEDVDTNIHGYDECSCPKCGSTDIDRDRKYCYKCGNRW